MPNVFCIELITRVKFCFESSVGVAAAVTDDSMGDGSLDCGIITPFPPPVAAADAVLSDDSMLSKLGRIVKIKKDLWLSRETC